MKKSYSIFFLFIVLLIFNGCTKPEDPAITLASDHISIEVDEDITISPNVTKGYILVWETSNSEIASVNNQGVITGEIVGVAYITVSLSQTDVSEIITVNVISKTLPDLIIQGPSEVMVGETANFQVLSEVLNVTWSTNDSLVAIIDAQGLLTAISVGFVNVTAELEGYNVGILSVQIKEVEPTEIVIDGKTSVVVGEHATYAYTLTPNTATGTVIWSTSNECLASINQLGEAIFYDQGEVVFQASIEDSSLTAQIIVNISLPIDDQTYIVDDDYASLSLNESVFFDQKAYQYGINAFSTINAALNVANSFSTIYILEGNYPDNFQIVKNDITIFGPNKNIHPGIDSRIDEAIITGEVTISEAVNNLIMNGLAFTTTALIIANGNNVNFAFSYNYIYDTNLETTPWVEDASYVSGFLVIEDLTNYSDQILISHNLFSNIGDVAINYSNVNGLKVIDNQFVDFSKDAIRSTKGIVNKNNQWLFMDNTFKNSNYNGLFFRTYGSSAGNIESIVSIFHNHFENLGQSEVMFSGALSFRNYQEGYTYVNISFNSFKNCSNYIMLRNNAMTVNQEHFVGTINYNQFVGIPKQYYLNNKNAIDSVSTNPNTINMDYNYYSNELGLSINLTEHSENFDGYSSNEHQLSSLDDFENYPKIYGSNVVRLDTLPKLIFDDGIIFASSNPNIATVDQEGKIVPLTFGEVIISASNGSYETKFRVVVKPSLNIDYVKKILEIAIGEEGYVEGTNNDTKYGTWYGMPNQPWCAMFVSWSANQAKISTTIIPKYASVSLGMQWFQEHQLFKLKGSYIPKAGDIIFFKSDGASHTGLVISSDGVKVYTIEGNTSNMVAKRNYLLNYSTITGYGTPNYPTYSGEPFVFDVSDSTDGSGANTR